MSKLPQSQSINAKQPCRCDRVTRPYVRHGRTYEDDKNDNLLQRFEYADQRMPISMTQNNQKYYLHYDQVGSLRAVSDSNHNIIKEVTYDTFGNILSDSNEAFRVPFGFAGGLYDKDTKLTRFGYRDYDAYTGKWTAKDPIGFDGGDSNLYGYVLGDPVSGIDPVGLDTLVIHNGATTTLNPFKINNPLGHSAIAFTGSGVYSFGNSTPIGSSLTDYIKREAPKRDTLVQIFKTTSYQEQIMKTYLNSLQSKKLEKWPDNCATRTSNALHIGGINNVVTGFPQHLTMQLYLLYNPQSIFIPKGSNYIDSRLYNFNP